jgi:single-stranded DNA-binding protein
MAYAEVESGKRFITRRDKKEQVIVGRLTNEPGLDYANFPQGLVELNIASETGWDKVNNKPRASWSKITLFGENAEGAVLVLRKGMVLGVVAKMGAPTVKGDKSFERLYAKRLHYLDADDSEIEFPLKFNDDRGSDSSGVAPDGGQDGETADSPGKSKRKGGNDKENEVENLPFS